ncbi:hypothetical protein L1887_44870 [Cichorium endivia]|nr:hypothetical protein L1887_44870 [Cichorium endivia]
MGNVTKDEALYQEMCRVVGKVVLEMRDLGQEPKHIVIAGVLRTALANQRVKRSELTTEAMETVVKALAGAASYCPDGSALSPARTECITVAAVNQASASVTVSAPGRSPPVISGRRYHIQKITKMSGMPRISSAHRKRAFRTSPVKRQARHASTIPPGRAMTAAPAAIINDSSTPPGSPVAARPHSR